MPRRPQKYGRDAMWPLALAIAMSQEGGTDLYAPDNPWGYNGPFDRDDKPIPEPTAEQKATNQERINKAVLKRERKALKRRLSWQKQK